jgi:hypothetical protein
MSLYNLKSKTVTIFLLFLLLFASCTLEDGRENETNASGKRSAR